MAALPVVFLVGGRLENRPSPDLLSPMIFDETEVRSMVITA
ncbi:hypothetical protein LT85_1102 [Collimonas arenae]|uniref:Uncharacterized protein n=1 Tax=Collimonas arenae TaxID=279058 RepID=A0A0A1F937_9BURK|nr:hypothetical protein LT85_1102 [Collimonas arenae]